MGTVIATNQEVELLNEFRLIPDEHRQSFMKIVKAYRESVGTSNLVTSPSFVSSELEQDFKESWTQAQRGEVYPIERFWEMLDAE